MSILPKFAKCSTSGDESSESLTMVRERMKNELDGVKTDPNKLVQANNRREAKIIAVLRFVLYHVELFTFGVAEKKKK